MDRSGRNGHLARLARAVGGEAVFDALVELPQRDLGWLLMAVLAARVDRIAPGDLLDQQERDAASRAADRGERLLSTGLGADLVCAKFAAG